MRTLTLLQKFEKEISKWDRIAEIGKQANSLIEEIVPHIYTDGDVRMIASDTYKVLKDLMDERNALLGLTQDERSLCRDLVYVGPQGTLTIKESK